MSDPKPKKEKKAKPSEAKDIKVVAESAPAEAKPKEFAKPDYGRLRQLVIERTVSIRQFEPLRLQLVYDVGQDDHLDNLIESAKTFSDVIDRRFHALPPAQPTPVPNEAPTPTAESPAPAPVTKPSQYTGDKQTYFDEPKPQAPGYAKYDGGARLPTPFPNESDGEFTTRCIKRAYAIWHNELQENPDLHPKAMGVTDREGALRYIKQYGSIQ